MFEREYSAPAKDASEFFGIKLHDDWGLTDHAAIQKTILPTDNVGDFWDSTVVEQLLANQRWADKYVGFNRYHAAMGMVSQYTHNETLYILLRLHYKCEIAKTAKLNQLLGFTVVGHCHR